MTEAELYVDRDGDLIVAIITEDDVAELRLVSEMRRPCSVAQPPSKIDSEGLHFLATVPEDRARLYIEHGCSLDDYETDRAIWAAEFVRYLGGCLFEDKARFSRGAAESADSAVKARWVAKGQS